MKNIFKIQLIVILLFISIGSVKAQKENLWQTYFPTNPSTEKWKEIKTHKEMTNILNLDKALFQKVSTNELFEIYLQYPLLLDIWAFNNLQTGFNSTKENFNGLQELLKRKDLKDIAIDKYSKALSQKDTFDIHFTQLLLSQKEIISILNIDDINNLSILTSEFIKQQINSKDYGLFGISVSTYFISHLTKFIYNPLYIYGVNEKQKESIIYFYNNCNIVNVNILNFILNKTVDITVKETKDEWVTVYTPNGNSVNAYKYDDEPLGWWARWRAKRYVIKKYPNATVKRDASGKYNCHSYAWYNQSSSNNKWINAYNSYYNGNCYSENLHEYWNDGSYQTSSSGYGKIASYGTCGDDDHSAKWTSSNKVISKWGQGCLVEHNYDYCPYNSSNITNYKEYIPQSQFECQITGPTSGENGITYTWHAYVTGGTVASYSWWYKPLGYHSYYHPINCNTESMSMKLPTNSSMIIKSTISITSGQSDTDYHFVINLDDPNEPPLPKNIGTIIANDTIAIISTSNKKQDNFNILEEYNNSILTIYPNPVNDILKIEIDEKEMLKHLKSQTVEIRLYDKMMCLKKKTSFLGNLTTINVSNLKPDIYILQIIIGDEIFKEKIIISDK